jgi:hypothetical protein
VAGANILESLCAERQGLFAALDDLGRLTLKGPLGDFVACAFSRVRLRAARVEPKGSHQILCTPPKQKSPIKGLFSFGGETGIIRRPR